MSEVSITFADDGKKGRFFIALPDGDAEMTFSVLSEKAIIVDHTGVPDSARGKGYANTLAEAAVADARDKGYKIVPLCPFLNRWRQKHPDSADVFQV